MKKLTIIFVILITATLASGQVIKGRLYDYNTNKPVENAHIFLMPDSTTVHMSNKKGWFRIYKSSKGYDTLVIKQPGYYKQIHVVNKVGKGLPQKIFLYPENIKLDTLCYYRFDNNVYLEGKVFDKQRSKKIPGISIIADNKKLSYSKLDGGYLAIVPGSADSISFQSEEFKTKNVYIGDYKKKESLEVKLNRKIPVKWDTAWRNYRNRIGININQLANGAFGMYYLRLINRKHAVGVEGVGIYNGYQVNLYTKDSRYKGYKISAIYRYYLSNKSRKGVYAQGKFTVSQFDFNPLVYYYRADYRDNVSTKESINPIGFGAGIGYYSFLPRTNRISINLYFGLRYLPMDVPTSYTFGPSYYESTYYLSNTWWYLYGAGSFLDFKFSICVAL